MTFDATVGGHNDAECAGTAGRGRAEQELWTAGHATPGVEINFSARRRTILQNGYLIGSHIKLLNGLGRAI